MRIPLTGLILVAAAAASAAGQTARAAVAPASKLWIEGTSNVHDWKCDASTIDATIDMDPAGLSAAPANLVRKVSIKIPVKDLKCGHGKMDENVQKALKADKNADITYTLSTAEALAGDSKDAFVLRTSGTLTVAGTPSSISMDISAIRQADGTVKATGTVPLKMTAFGVKPPTAMLGAIKCGDDIKVKFDLV